jgi:hypothetical protein
MIQRALLVAMLAIAGCSSSGTTGGTTSAACAKDTDCKDDRICVQGACVSPGGSSTTPGSTTGDDGGGSGHAPRCGADGTTCICAVDGPYYDSASLKEGVSCSGSQCCGDPEWPSRGTCICHEKRCHESAFGDTCICSAASPSAGDKEVSSCTGKVCCISKSDIAPMCSCFDTLSQCPDADDIKVPSCSTSDMQCAGRALSSCN